MQFIYVTCKDREEARKVSHTLVEKKIAACVNYFPISSHYWWEGKVIHDREFALIINSGKNNFNEVKKAVKKLHSYEKPAIISINTKEVDEKFLKWLCDSQKE